MELKHRSPTVEEYRKLRSLVGWWDTDEDATRSALNNSLSSVVATERDTVIGFGRVAGDGGLYFYIQDLIVHPEYRSKGIGRAIMKELMAYLKTNAKPGSYIALMAAKGLQKYYEPFGFEARYGDAPGMYQVLK
ncbi:MAG: GNAT family N-acetyltransferase [Desulfobacteraceae bacterium]|nr:GNAT family N-acetyltransferase [Desulfobacteraceae bacterium]